MQTYPHFVIDDSQVEGCATILVMLAPFAIQPLQFIARLLHLYRSFRTAT